jgi:hypothetical protein
VLAMLDQAEITPLVEAKAKGVVWGIEVPAF